MNISIKLLSCSSLFRIGCLKRHVVLLERQHLDRIKPRKFNDINVWPDLNNNSNKVFNVISNDDEEELPLDIILIKNVEGLGYAGDILSADRSLARMYLFPNKQALYASPENITKTEHIRVENANIPRQSLTGQETIRWLKKMNLPIPMNSKTPWVLTNEHVHIAFRCVGANVPLDCIELLDNNITKPGEYNINVTVNKIDTISIKAIVYHYFVDEKDGINCILPNVWTDPKFQIGQEIN